MCSGWTNKPGAQDKCCIIYYYMEKLLTFACCGCTPLTTSLVFVHKIFDLGCNVTCCISLRFLCCPWVWFPLKSFPERFQVWCTSAESLVTLSQHRHPAGVFHNRLAGGPEIAELQLMHALYPSFYASLYVVQDARTYTLSRNFTIILLWKTWPHPQ